MDVLVGLFSILLLVAHVYGQYADLRIEGVAEGDSRGRSYSFASAALKASTRVEFFVREVPGGAFSTSVNREKLSGF